MEEQKLIALNQQGIIPGPQETEEDFQKRAEYCLGLHQHIPELMENEQPFQNEDFLKDSLVITNRLFGISPKWIPVYFSNYSLTPWHGGCAWIFQLAEESPTGAIFQLRRTFRDSKKYLGIYDRDELMSHEMAHVGRMMYDEPKFEEILAYRTSRSPIRRWLGPIVQSSLESMLFVLVILMTLFFDLFLIFMQPDNFLMYSLWLKTIPLAVVAFALMRLWRRHRTFSRCWRNLFEHFQDEHRTNGIIYRLTDQEIIAFASASQQQIADYMVKEESLRWKLIKKAYMDKRAHG